MDPPVLTDDQAAVYDRQLRVWGVEVQNRLSNAKVLIAGGDGVAAEVAKNLVLAGVGHVAIADDTPCSSASFGNFLVAADSDPLHSVAEASVRTLQAMNPLIKVVSVPGSATQLPDSVLQGADLVVASGLTFSEVSKLDERCTQLGRMLFTCSQRGPSSITFVNLQTHTYAEKGKDGARGPDQTVQFCSFEQALTTPGSKLTKRTHPLYKVLKASVQFEKAHGRPPGPADVDVLQATAHGLASSEGGSPAAKELLESWAMDEAELAPVAAVVGGIVANQVIRAVSGVEMPMKNLLFFSLFDNSGAVEDMPMAA
mmetsp:Transcript_15887/g.34291  ORF Transcript_15887/g.34291 Transcript_15887/m.34291 type:complete len:313 (+) Transcript_15887:84-1022(+)|eukprot:CAMPEP_0202904346 /NCGR_PEP_ID=MMETSP1392-20130828/28950_1 /ASSEMBLY_ACC=CAM_ASM_000868 /TAXON_ID=225041 /ORGANISM="Chlamydomonas chlamydogama, Strain SAG 11-48b" /LENGTH=312 /DNA_ID=CAMNT_0049591919 /DNA_START=1 /DNA_END=939 /DNA_ORIENTATION=-